MKQPSTTLWDAYAAAAARAPDRRLVVASRDRPGEAKLSEVVARGAIVAANLRRLGVGPGDVVAVQMPAWIEWLIAAVAVAHCGAVLLPVVAIYGAGELGFILRQSRARVLITPDRFRKGDFVRIVAECGALPDLRHHVVVGSRVPRSALGWGQLERPQPPTAAAPNGPDDLALLVYTSGTTSEPKGVRHSSRGMLAEMDALAWQRRELRDWVVLSPWPPGHVAGAINLLRFLVGHTDLVLMDVWDPVEAARLIEAHRVTSCATTPFHLHGLLDAAERFEIDLSSLFDCMTGAAPVPTGLVARAEHRGLRIYRCYGSSEHPTVTSGNPGDPLDKRLTTEGRPMRGSEIALVDDEGRFVAAGGEGELVTRGPELFLGYLDPALDEAAFLPGGWFRTGDVGHVDQEGYLLVTDRKKDVIIRGGETISSKQVEEVLFTHPAVAEAAAVAAPDARLGEIVAAYVVPRPGFSLKLEDIAAHFASLGMARAKTPELLVLVDELPRNATGKVLKHELRRHVRAATGG